MAKIALQNLSGDLLYQPQLGGWSLQARELRIQTGEHPWPPTSLALLASSGQLQLGVAAIDLQALTPLLPLFPLDRTLATALGEISLRGTLSDIRANLKTGDDSSTWAARANFQAIGSRLWSSSSVEGPDPQSASEKRGPGTARITRLPGLYNFSGQIHLQPKEVRIILDSRNAQLDLRPLFRDPLPLSRLLGAIRWRRSGEGWTLESTNLQADTPHIKTISRVLLEKRAGQPLFADLQTDFREGDGRHASIYYPVSIMSDNLVAWLDEAIVFGRVPQGSFMLYGPLDHFPFHTTHDGHFEVLFQTEGVRLAYRPNWPPLEETGATVRFHNNSLVIETDDARLYQNRVLGAQVKIPSLKPASHLEIKGRTRGPLSDHFRLLRETPLKQTLARHLEGLKIGGNGTFDMALRIPLGKTQSKTPPDFKGALTLDNASLTLTPQALTIDKLNGVLKIDNQGIGADNLQATMLDTPLQISIHSHEAQTRVEATGRMTAEALLKYYPQLVDLGITGSTQLELNLELPDKGVQADTGVALEIRSRLQGLGMNLPPPLGKRPDQSRSFKAAVETLRGEAAVRIQLGEDLGLTLGKGPQGHILNAKISRLPLREWLKWSSSRESANAEGAALQHVTLQIAELEATPLQASRLELDAYHNNGQWRGKVSSDNLQGNFRFDGRAHRQALILELDRLHLVTSDDTQPAAGQPPPDLMPEDFPELHINARQFRFNKADLGNLTLTTRRTGDATRQVIETLALKGGMADISIEGDWERVGKTSITRLHGSLLTPDAGQLLEKATAVDFLSGSKSHVGFDLNWPGALFQFDPARLEGTAQLDMTAGRFIHVKPGAARILGLFNLRELGRRLQFDFKDVYEKGLAFDNIIGDFHLDGGLIYTSNLEINAPSSIIRIAGSTDLVQRTHDQVISVSPRLDTTLPVAGAIAGGPVTGLVVLLAQQALSKRLEKIQQLSYSVTGSWDEPQIEPLRATPQADDEEIDLLDQ